MLGACKVEDGPLSLCVLRLKGHCVIAYLMLNISGGIPNSQE